jgi:hypothetical protein
MKKEMKKIREITTGCLSIVSLTPNEHSLPTVEPGQILS